ncbi:MAG: hypothetical protein IJ201_10245 [Solobacterium sp.]|nr:hypothetical protein [Solobacterium sp.]
MIMEEETVEKIVLPVPESTLKVLSDSAARENITVKEYILRLIEQDVRRKKNGIAPEKIAAVLSQDNELSRRLREAQARFDILTKENAEATVQMINAKLENHLSKVAEIQQQIMPRIAEEKNRILNEIRNLIESENSSEDR